MSDLQSRLAGGEGDVDRLVFDPPTSRPTITSAPPGDPAPEGVTINSPTITFFRPAGNAVIRLKENTDTTFVVNNNVQVATQAQTNLAEYAAHVKAQFEAAGFGRVVHTAPGQRPSVGVAFYDTGLQVPQADSLGSMENLAGLLKSRSRTIRIEGFTDRQGRPQPNLALGEARALGIQRLLTSHGVEANTVRLTDPPTRGEAAAAAAGDDDRTENQEFRRTLIYTSLQGEHWLFISRGPDFDPAAVGPNDLDGTNPNEPNAYMYLFHPTALNLGNRGVTIDSNPFEFAGGPVGGHAAGSAAAYAQNLTDAINQSPTHRAWRIGSVIHVAERTDTFTVRLFTTTSRQINVTESDSYTITQQFTTTSNAVQSQDQEQNRTIAVGVTVDARFSRTFETEVTGNSAITARLVSVPAPPEFLKMIADYQNSLNP